MRKLAFFTRNMKEILRDPLNLCFGLGFPIVLLLLLSIIQANIPVSLFEIEILTPGIAVFGLSFITLFSATLIAKDRETALMQRLYTTPMQAVDFIAGYALPMLPLSLAQCMICYAVAAFLGLPITVGILYGVFALIPTAWFFICLGLLCGSVLNSKQVGGICGALLTNLTAWLSGVWFDLSLVGGIFQKIAGILPFVHAVELERLALQGDLAGCLPHLLWVMGYALAVSVVAVAVFVGQMKHSSCR